MVPKLVAEDIPLLQSLLSDVFPGVKYISADMRKLKAEIKKVCEEMHLVYGEGEDQGAAWVDKVCFIHFLKYFLIHKHFRNWIWKSQSYGGITVTIEHRVCYKGQSSMDIHIVIGFYLHVSKTTWSHCGHHQWPVTLEITKQDILFYKTEPSFHLSYFVTFKEVLINIILLFNLWSIGVAALPDLSNPSWFDDGWSKWKW